MIDVDGGFRPEIAENNAVFALERHSLVDDALDGDLLVHAPPVERLLEDADVGVMGTANHWPRELGGSRGESGQWQVVALCHHHRLLLASLLQLISKCFGRVLSADFFLLKC